MSGDARSGMTTAATLPLSLSQRDFVAPTGSVNASVRFEGELSVSALRRALGFVTQRHEALRMRLMRSGDRLLQRIVEPADSYDLDVVPVSDTAAAEERIATSLRSAKDLEKRGPLHVQLMKVAPAEHVLLLVIHTVAIDRYSLNLLLKELLTSYACYARDEEPRLPPAMRYVDYVLDETRRGVRLGAAEMHHWRHVLDGNRYPIPRLAERSADTGTWRAAVCSITSTECPSSSCSCRRLRCAAPWLRAPRSRPTARPRRCSKTRRRIRASSGRRSNAAGCSSSSSTRKCRSRSSVSRCRSSRLNEY
jgi:hypothetical protein